MTHPADWEFPVDLIATERQVDDVIIIEAELGKTSAVGFRLTSTTRCVCVCLLSCFPGIEPNKPF